MPVSRAASPRSSQPQYPAADDTNLPGALAAARAPGHRPMPDGRPDADRISPRLLAAWIRDVITPAHAKVLPGDAGPQNMAIASSRQEAARRATTASLREAPG